MGNRLTRRKKTMIQSLRAEGQRLRAIYPHVDEYVEKACQTRSAARCSQCLSILRELRRKIEYGVVHERFICLQDQGRWYPLDIWQVPPSIPVEYFEGYEEKLGCEQICLLLNEPEN